MVDGIRRRLRTACAGLCAVALACVIAAAASAGPVVPGHQRLKNEAKADAVAQGQLLLGELNCVACHAAPGAQRISAKPAPDLAQAGQRLTPQFLRAYLADPHGVKPGATMPDVLHGRATPAEIDPLVHFLVSLGGPIAPAREEGNSMLVERGRQLYHSVGCVACHEFQGMGAAQPGAADAGVPSVPFGKLAMKTTVDRLAEFLMDPLKTRAGGRMPQVGLSQGEATAIAVFLLREQIDNPQAKSAAPPRARGLKYLYYEGDFNSCEVARLDAKQPKSQGTTNMIGLKLPGKRGNNYAVKFTGAIAIPKDGKYQFWTKSDDGSRLYVGGSQLIDNDGVHPPAEKTGSVELKAGDHPFTVTFFQGGGGDELTVEWQGPGIKRQPIPADVLFSVGGQPMVPLATEDFKVDPQKAAKGREAFASLGCASCHTTAGMQPPKPATALAALKPEMGCLAEKVPAGVPDYHLSADQRQVLAAAIKDAAALASPLPPKEQVVRQMAALNCYACHKRDDIGGPSAERADFFTMTAEFDMGDEGRIPPLLSGVGAKLRPEAMEQIIFESKLHVRPVLATRMPRFARPSLEGFVDAATKADTVANEPAEVKFSAVAAKDGRQLFGVKGLGCVNCHGVMGNKSLGMPAPDLTSAYERLRYPFFHKICANPASVNPGTRMPAFWNDGIVALKDVAGGTVDGQISALWTYLSLGKSMSLPSGLEPSGGMELIPVDEPIVHRTFMAEVGPRAVLVGFPDQLHVAFDANAVRLAKAWRGRFFDAGGMWEGRGGKANGPLGIDVMNLPPGPSFAVLQDSGAAWPEAKGKENRDIGGQFKGYVLDVQMRPIFRYVLDGIEIHEQPLPLLRPGGAALQRKFELNGNAPAGLHLLAAAGKSIEAKEAGVWIVDEKITVRVTGAEATIRESNGNKQLIAPVKLQNGKAAVEVEMSW